MADFSDPQGDYNPYAPPAGLDALPPGSSSDDELVISARRGTRWWARFIDGVLLAVTAGPAGFAFMDSYRASRLGSASFVSPMTFVLGLIPLTLLCYQWFLISTRGQTLGKKWLGIKIIRLDGSPVGFVYGVVLREWVLSGAGMIPYVGNIVGLVDVLMIFGNDRRCLHDHIAGTRVVQTLGNR